ncbi:MAG: Signal-transduction histidine kinase senX3 [Candidatus Thorarchaeota archaeon AB_25]|nr:MAG: Signal-transduction histidine kinase senX3 [Candidatus Thorarchaeota archaeon AB_25]
MSRIKDEVLLRAFLDNAHELIQSIRPDGSLEYVNPTWLRTLGYTEDDTDSIKLKDFVFPGYVRKTEEALSKVMNGQSFHDFTTTLQTKTGNPVKVEGIFFPRYKDKHIEAAGAIFRDLNKQTDVRDALIHERSRVETILDLITYDLTNFNKEILTILADALSTNELPQPLENLFREGVNEVERSSNFLSNIMELWRVARRAPHLLSCDLGETFHAAKELVEKTYPHRKLALTTSLESGQYYVTADEFLLEVFKSLLHYHMRNDTRTIVQLDVEVESLSQTSFLKLQLKDHGPGMSDEEKSEIFNHLSQKHHSSRGLGLDLTLVWHVLENYGGFIRVDDRIEGQPKEGSNFILLLRRSQTRQSRQNARRTGGRDGTLS